MSMTRHIILSPLARQSARPRSTHQLELMADNINTADLLIELKPVASAFKRCCEESACSHAWMVFIEVWVLLKARI